jgi:hypothetical protein
MGAGLGVIQSMIGKRTSEELAQVHLIPLTKSGVVDQNIGSWAFQYWPESVTIGSGAEYASKNVLGGSHPLRQFLYCTDRTLGFRADFTRDYQGTVRKVKGLKFASSGTVVQDRYNVDVAQAFIWLESLKTPDYDVDSEPGGFAPPPLLYLIFPNCRYGRAYNGEPSDIFQCVLLNVSLTSAGHFPDGTPRHSAIDLSFAEVVQGAGGVRFTSRSKMANATNGGQRYGVSIARPQIMRR